MDGLGWNPVKDVLTVQRSVSWRISNIKGAGNAAVKWLFLFFVFSSLELRFLIQLLTKHCGR